MVKHCSFLIWIVLIYLNGSGFEIYVRCNLVPSQHYFPTTDYTDLQINA